ncbi:MAG: group II truncated hemoglobin [Neisseria sp.]|nr:group II truncated hemoglobin [Neisseria sp.]
MSLFEILGGSDGVADLTHRFYDLMELEPQYAQLRAVHGQSLDFARERLYKFLHGWMGGEPLYQQEYGHPRLRQRHFPFAVTLQTRNQWIACFAQAMQEVQVAQSVRPKMLLHLFAMADWMRNQPEEGVSPPISPVDLPPAMRVAELQQVLHTFGLHEDFTDFAEP